MKPKVPLILGFDGLSLDEDTKRHLAEINPWGIILFKRNLDNEEQIRWLIAELRALLSPVLISLDHEGGVVNRFPANFAFPPSAYALSHLEDPISLKKAAKMLAALPAHFGFDLNFAPCIDLFDSVSPVIGIRGFSADPNAVANWGLAVLEAHKEAGMLSVAKHFPGHGRAFEDSHFKAGEVAFTRQSLDELDLVPFKKLIEGGVPLVMPAHLTYLDLDPEYPASLSERVLSGILKRELGFKGLVVSDCLEMQGLSVRFAPKEMIELGANAGLDLWVSSYSLKKDRFFQRQLAEVLRSEEIMGPNARIEALFNRPKPTQPLPLGGISEALDLRQKTLKVEGQPIRHGGPWHLIEVSARRFEGINADQVQTSLIRKMAEQLAPVERYSQISLSNLKALEDIVVESKGRGELVLLITRNARFHEAWEEAQIVLGRGGAVIHLDLSDGEDQVVPALQKWSCFGYDSLSLQLLCGELIARIA
ncbi:MAG: hypothetical protein A2527_10445 [Candidatus Lambdaproteobacteria bacterium RIFOXYD2_FULL_50_16]|uniref:beta-N-acetylhexosaminidase n=1 Tax=Candidatus Lambdaproteobacteria bacterium RIFOXYD2_FULL_50_16 TaxID=1817772 RepID=A0A1F6GGL8_9PROT|nr:MAG: hypothetical protein A2527_10445 [Candidatus Lambdaproteobacteria bacterium RIFOXYD2_FULL_50_16]